MESSGTHSLCCFIQQEFPKVVPIAVMSWSHYKSPSSSRAQGLSEKGPHPFLLSALRTGTRGWGCGWAAGSSASLGKSPLSCTYREAWRDNGAGLGVGLPVRFGDAAALKLIPLVSTGNPSSFPGQLILSMWRGRAKSQLKI